MFIKNWHDTCWYPIIQRKIDLKWFQGDQDALRHTQQPRQAQPWWVQQVLVMDHFKTSCKLYHVSFFMNIAGTSNNCCTRNGWAYQGLPEHFQSNCLCIIGFQHVLCQFLMNITGMLYSPWLSLAWSLRVSESTVITLGPFWIDLSLKNK